MHNKPSSGITPQLVMGLIIVTVGILFTLDNLEILNAREYLRYWPALLIVFGLSKLTYAHRGGKLFGALLIIGGTLLLLDRLYFIEFEWSHFWPLVLIVIGGSILWNSMRRHRSPPSTTNPPAESDSTISHFTTLGGIERMVNTQDFRGGDLTAVLGGIEIDFRQASIKSGEAIVELFALWGGISIKVPQDWSVTVQVTPIMGGVEDTTIQPKGDSTKRLIVKGTAIMGGAEIKN